MVEIKICGLSTPEAIEAAIAAGASYIGLVHFAPSARHVSLEKAGELCATARSRIRTVLLLVDADAETTARAIDAVRPEVIQFHGSETPEWCALVRDRMGLEVWKALGVRDAETLGQSRRFDGAVDRLLFDAPAGSLPGGTGIAFDWQLLADFDHTIPWGLAGGLTPENVAAAIRATGAPLIDASSGLEISPGVKDPARIAAFCAAARNASSA